MTVAGLPTAGKSFMWNIMVKLIHYDFKSFPQL